MSLPPPSLFFFNDTATTEIYTLSLHDALPISLTAFESWPEFGDLLGGRYDGHPWGSAPGTVINEAPDFPATRHFPATLDIADEFYRPKAFSRDKARVLLRLDASKMPPNAEYHGTNGDMPLVWAKTCQGPRVLLVVRARRGDVGQPQCPSDVFRSAEMGAWSD